MADKKISQLPVATTPLAGTEVLPIVQSGTTDQVSVANLTAGRAISATQYTSTIATGTAPLVVASTTEVANLKAATATLADSATSANAVKSNATTGLLQVTGPAAASTRVMTTPDANFTVARTDAGQTFGGDQVITGNVGLNVTPSAWSGNGRAIQFYNTGNRASALAGYYGAVGLFNDAYFANDNNVKYYSGGAVASYTQSAGTHSWSTAAAGSAGATATMTQVMGIDTSGNITVNTGNVVIGTSGKGIDFSATASGSGTMTSELLADYEEGTWTPTFIPQTGSFGNIIYTPGGTLGRYTKIGRTVILQGSIQTSTITVGTASGSLFISGFPYTSINPSGYGAYFPIIIGEVSDYAVNTPSTGAVIQNSTKGALEYRATANGPTQSITVADLSTALDKNITRFTIIYEAA